MADPESRKPPAFWCPKCHQKHRADLKRLLDRPGSTMRAVCKGCGIALGVSLGSDGMPQCVALEEPETAVEARPGATPTAASPAPTAPAPGVAPAAAPAAPGAAAAPAEGEFAPETLLGRYTVQEVIGRGGTGTVYRAFDPTTNRTVALKVLNRGLSDAMRERFLREIQVQANIRHQNIMPVFDRGELDDGRPFFTMELLYAPRTLTEIVELRDQGKLHRMAELAALEDLKTLVRTVLVPVTDGIYVANVENGVVHRDLKPDNALIDSRTHRPYVIDFGICHVMEKQSGLSSAVVPTATEDGGVLGTPRFLSPEQARGSVHARTDVWGLGALLHFVLAGEPPIAGAVPITRAELGRRVEALKEAKALALGQGDQRKAALCADKIERLTAEGMRTLDDIFRDAREGRYGPLPETAPPPLAAIVRKAMAPVPADRYVNARQLAGDLEAWLKGGTVRALADFGGAGAAVDTARRALKRHVAAALWALGGVVLGLLAGLALGGGASAGPSGERLRLLQRDIEGLKAESDQVAFLEAQAGRAREDGARATPVPDWTPLAEQRVWKALDARAAELEKRVKAEPESPDRDAVAERLAFVRGRFRPGRVRIEAAGRTPVVALDLDTNVATRLSNGENTLPPGLYRVTFGEGAPVSAPLRVPLRIRTDQEDPSREAALVSLEIPVGAEIPRGMALVIGGTVRARDLPFSEPASETFVRPFLVDLREVTNAEYGRFLRDLPETERRDRSPSVGFSAGSIPGEVAPSPETEEHPVVGLRPQDARAYAAWRASREGAAVRLPSEAEWALMAGGALGWLLPNGFRGTKVEGDLLPPMRPAGSSKVDVSPYGVKGLYGNAREMVLPLLDDASGGDVLVKGAGVGDEPDAAAIYRLVRLGPAERDPRTGFRCVREIK